ncbi:MAG TPA: RNA 2',3'-cyclic phosphodiesterase [Cellulomonas sp.]
MRVFVGLWPTPGVAEHLRTALRTAVGVDPADAPGRSPDGVRWTAAECWHVTLAFYGEVGDGVVEALTDAMADVAARAHPFDLALTGAGVFSHRTLWAGVGGDVEAVHSLVDACRGVADDLGVRQDRRERSRPHLTLGRVAPDRGGPRRDRGRDGRDGRDGHDGHGGRDSRDGGRDGGRRGSRRGDDGPAATDLLVHALSVYRGPRWPVGELVLAESRPGEGRAGSPLYLPLGRWPLGRPPLGRPPVSDAALGDPALGGPALGGPGSSEVVVEPDV